MPFDSVSSKRSLRLILSVALISLFLTNVNAQNSNSPTAVSETAVQYSFGEPGLEFSMQVPPLWVVQEGMGGYAAVLKPSAKAPRFKLPGGVVADPTITIAASKKQIEFSTESLEANAAEIEQKFIEANGTGTEFQIFQKNIVEDLASGRKGLLYYISYRTDAAEVAQAVLMTGHQGARYRITLSDHKANFDRNLELYYPYMVSINFQTPVVKTLVPGLSNDLLLWGLGVVVAGAAVGFIARLRRSQRQEFGVKRRHRRAPAASQTSAAPASFNEHSSNLSQGNNSADPTTEISQLPFDSKERGGRPSDTSDFVEAAFSASDLSCPPQSIPLSQVVDEHSVPPDLKKRWQIVSKSDDETEDLEDSFKGKNRG